MTKKGFTLIELLIVITIIAILVGVAVPYYNDYIYDARLSTLKQNLATYRQVLNQFRGDNLRGPLNVIITCTDLDVTHSSATSAADSELIAGPIQIIEGIEDAVKRRTNLQYLFQMPVFLNPRDGSPVPTSAWNLTNPTAFFYDSNDDGIFDIDNELAFVDNDGDGIFTTGIDTTLFLGATTGGTLPPLPLDYTSFAVKIDGVDY